jgi:hypothetical protein
MRQIELELRHFKLVVRQDQLVECLGERAVRHFEAAKAPPALDSRRFGLEGRLWEPEKPPVEIEVTQFVFVLPQFESEEWQNEDDLWRNEDDLPHFQEDVPHNELEVPQFLCDEPRFQREMRRFEDCLCPVEREVRPFEIAQRVFEPREVLCTLMQLLAQVDPRSAEANR